MRQEKTQESMGSQVHGTEEVFQGGLGYPLWEIKKTIKVPVAFWLTSLFSSAATQQPRAERGSVVGKA